MRGLRFWCKPKVTILNKKEPLIFYLRHYWVVIESFTLSFACGTKNRVRNILKNFFFAKFNLGLIFQYLKIWPTTHLWP
jgi:hypothetical protein